MVYILEFPIMLNSPWYHGSNIEFNVLDEGSTITQWRELAEAFAAKPVNLEYDYIGGSIKHNGTEKCILYIVDEKIMIDVDIYQHPRSSMDNGVEFLTKRPLKVRRIL